MLSAIKKLKKSLAKTRDTIFGQIGSLIKGRKLDDDLIDDIEEILLKADVGVSATEKILDNLREKASENKISDSEEILNLLKDKISKILVTNRRKAITENSVKPIAQQSANWLIISKGRGKRL